MFSIIIQGGSFALIAYLVVYAWPKAVQRLADSHDKALDTFQATYKTQSERHETKSTQMIEAFAREQKYERDQCDRHHQELMNLANKNHDVHMRGIDTTRHEIRGHLQTVVNALSGGKFPLRPTEEPQHGG